MSQNAEKIIIETENCKKMKIAEISVSLNKKKIIESAYSRNLKKPSLKLPNFQIPVYSILSNFQIPENSILTKIVNLFFYKTHFGSIQNQYLMF